MKNTALGAAHGSGFLLSRNGGIHEKRDLFMLKIRLQGTDQEIDPRMLIKDENFKGLSSDAKLLYGLMLDRMSLSIKNGWFDNDNRAYIIYTIDNIMEDLGCGKDKAVKVVAELDQKKGIGLIEKVRRGLGTQSEQMAEQ